MSEGLAEHAERAAFNDLFHVSCEFVSATDGRLREEDAEIAEQVGVYSTVQNVVDRHGLSVPHAFALLGTALGRAFKERERLEEAGRISRQMAPEDFISA